MVDMASNRMTWQGYEPKKGYKDNVIHYKMKEMPMIGLLLLGVIDSQKSAVWKADLYGYL